MVFLRIQVFVERFSKALASSSRESLTYGLFSEKQCQLSSEEWKRPKRESVRRDILIPSLDSRGLSCAAGIKKSSLCTLNYLLAFPCFWRVSSLPTSLCLRYMSFLLEIISVPSLSYQLVCSLSSLEFLSII